MSAMLPMAMFGLEVPAGDVAIVGKPDIPSAYRITMAAIDPTAEPEGDEDQPPRATLKVIRQPLLDSFDDDEYSEDSEDFDADEMEAMLADEEDEDSEDDEELNGGPSDPAKSRKAQEDAIREDIKKQLAESGMDLDEALPNGTNGIKKSAKGKGKMPVSDDDEDDDEDIDIDSDSDLEDGAEIEEFVICTLDPSKNYQQPLDLTIGEDERVWFKVTGTHTIYLTGNYVEPLDKAEEIFDPDSDEEEDYDLEPDLDELDGYEDESEDELDELEDARITELLEEEEAEAEPPKLIKASKADKKASANKNKRPATDSADEEDAEAATLDEMIAKAKEAADPVAKGEQKLSKKQLKKLKKNDGNAAAAPAAAKAEEQADASSKSDKKVSFAKQLEQGPTPTKEKSGEADKAKASLGAKVVQGVTIDDRKIGSGQAAKSGDRIGMRYIGKLKDGKVFDSNKKGKPFSFKLGVGEVIKGWDVGVQGMQVGGERRITIPAHLAYGSKRTGDIPANSTLIFDIKMMEIGKGK